MTAHYQSVTYPERRPQTFISWLLFMQYENKAYVSTRKPVMNLENTTNTMEWTEVKDENDVPEMLELMFYTRYGKTLIGVRVGHSIKCGNQPTPLEDITHYAPKPTPHDKDQN